MNEGLSPQDRDRLEQSGRECFGRLTASLSHELNNVVSIIDQNTGLMSDLLATGDNPVVIDRTRLEKIVTRFSTQAERGTALIRLLNTFAHSVDEDKLAADPAELVRLTQSLWRRAAEMRRVEIEIETKAGGAEIPVRPFLVLWALFLALRGALDKCPPGQAIKIKTEMSSTGPRIIVDMPLEGAGEIAVSADLENLMNCCQGWLYTKKEAGRFAQELQFKGHSSP